MFINSQGGVLSVENWETEKIGNWGPEKAYELRVLVMTWEDQRPVLLILCRIGLCSRTGSHYLSTELP